MNCAQQKREEKQENVVRPDVLGPKDEKFPKPLSGLGVYISLKVNGNESRRSFGKILSQD